MSEKFDNRDKFNQIIKDFAKDLIRTFPDKITRESNAELYAIVGGETESTTKTTRGVGVSPTMYEFCKEIYPKQFFNILYENEELFTSQDVLELLPGVNFVELWKENITDKTKSIIWKYLQLVLFCVINNLESNESEESFGDAAKLFEAINQDEFKQKIEETISQMDTIFNTASTNENANNENANENVNNENANNENGTTNDNKELPNADELHSHINQMMEGKLGCLAKEIAEETAADLDINVENVESVNDVFQQLFKNPGKLMNLVKNVGSKLDDKIKSGNIKESELLEEASDLVNKMKNMPGMGNLESMFSKMGIPGMGNGAKVDMNAFSKHMEQNMRTAKMKDRMRSKLEANMKNATAKDSEQKATATTNMSDLLNELNLENMKEFNFSTGDNVEKSKKPSNKKKKKANRKK